MRRSEIIEVIDGTHPTATRTIALAHQALIAISAVAIALETVPGLPGWAVRTLAATELLVLSLFAAEYVLRVVCANRPLRYVFSFWGVIDLLSWLPLIAVMNANWAALRTFRLLRLIRVLKLLHSNRALHRLEQALSQSRGELVVFAFLGFIVLYIAAVGIYIFEHEAQPEAFSSIPKSLWWAIVSFTTVGYGDLYPVTAEGRIFTAVVLFVGLGVIAVPTAVITSALIRTQVHETIESEVEEEVREELAEQAQKGRSRRKHNPTRRS
jgi:voltage-gated potassium channel